MGQQYSEIPDKQKQFNENQKIFFVGTATTNSRVNISPKGIDSLRVLREPVINNVPRSRRIFISPWLISREA